MEKSKKKIEAPLVLSSEYEEGWKAALFWVNSIVFIADGNGKVFFYDYETSENITEFKPNDGKLIFGVHKTDEILLKEDGKYYSYLYLLYKDGTLDIFIFTINGDLALNEEKVLSKLQSLQTPLSMMMQVPKLESYFTPELQSLSTTNPFPSPPIPLKPLQTFFTKISQVPKPSQSGNLNTIELTQHGIVFLGYESGLIQVCRYDKTTQKVDVLHKGFQWESYNEQPPIILSILPIEEEGEKLRYTLFVGLYTQYIEVLYVEIDRDLGERDKEEREEYKEDEEKKEGGLFEQEFSKSDNKQRKKVESLIMTHITTISDTGFKPGVWAIKYIQRKEWILVGSFDYRARLYRMKNRAKPRLVGLLKHHKKLINSIDYRFIDNGNCEVLLASEDGSVTLWTLPF